MPTYDYKCNACRHTFEVFHSMTEVKRKCPKCGKNALERLIGTGGAVIFKGSGFYQTDYRSESYKKSASAESGASEGKSDSKSDGKAGSKSGPSEGAKPDAKPAPKPEVSRSDSAKPAKAVPKPGKPERPTRAAG